MLLLLKLFKKCTKPDHPLPVLPQKGCSQLKASKDSLKSFWGKGMGLKRPQLSASLSSTLQCRWRTLSNPRELHRTVPFPRNEGTNRSERAWFTVKQISCVDYLEFKAFRKTFPRAECKSAPTFSQTSEFPGSWCEWQADCCGWHKSFILSSVQKEKPPTAM